MLEAGGSAITLMCTIIRAYAARSRHRQHGNRTRDLSLCGRTARLRLSWRRTGGSRPRRHRPPMNTAVLIRQLFAMRGLEMSAVRGIIVASVVPPLESLVRQMCERYFSDQGDVHRAGDQDGDAGALRQSRRGRGRPHRERHRRLREVQAELRGGGLWNRDDLRCGFGARANTLAA